MDMKHSQTFSAVPLALFLLPDSPQIYREYFVVNHAVHGFVPNGHGFLWLCGQPPAYIGPVSSDSTILLQNI